VGRTFVFAKRNPHRLGQHDGDVVGRVGGVNVPRALRARHFAHRLRSALVQTQPPVERRHFVRRDDRLFPGAQRVEQARHGGAGAAAAGRGAHRRAHRRCQAERRRREEKQICEHGERETG